MSHLTDDLTRRIADCLEEHLHEYGWEPYRYPNGEHKGVHMFSFDEVNDRGRLELIHKSGLVNTVAVLSTAEQLFDE